MNLGEAVALAELLECLGIRAELAEQYGTN